MAYIDGFMAAVKTADRDAYRVFLDHQQAIFVEYGATRVVDGWGDDVPDGKRTDMKRAVAAEADETVAFGWIEWPDKATRTVAWDKVMQDPRMTPGASPMPFDGSRMIFGGFDVIARTDAG